MVKRSTSGDAIDTVEVYISNGIDPLRELLTGVAVGVANNGGDSSVEIDDRVGEADVPF